MGVYLYPNNTETELKNAYIGEYTGLPNAYQKVEYIENNWTCYINIWLQVKDWYKFVGKILCTQSDQNNWWRITWAYIGYESWVYYRLYFWGLYNNKWSYGYLGSHWNWTLWSGSLNTDYDVEFSWVSWNAFIKVDWTTLFNSSSTYSTTLSYECKLFASNDGPHPWLRVYSAKYYNNTDTLVRDLVPCYRKSDNVIWMYDLVNDQFYTNNWTWTFTKWPNVN